jgi:hypothetical protein
MTTIAEIQELWALIMSKEDKRHFFNINEIDGVKADVLLNYDDDDSEMQFIIRNLRDVDTYLYVKCFKTAEELATFIIEKLPELRYEKYSNTFNKPRKHYDHLLKFHNVKLAGDECCVCYERTKNATLKCHHPICLQCISTLSKCPICRKCLNCDCDESDEE